MSDRSNALTQATAIGTVAQLAMVISGHFTPAIANLFAVGGMGISLVAGLLYARKAVATTRGASATGGALAGGICALIGIIVSFALGDVTAMIIAFGTLSSAVTGAIGGAIGHVRTARP
jgi:hypothetical protein